MERRIDIFVLAAGRGERLLPITRHLPKPLMPLLGRPLLQVVLERVSALPAEGIGINLHHGRGLIEEWIERSAFRDRLVPFVEERLLGTGGALKNAEAFLCSRPFLVHNSDILTDMDLEDLLEAHLSSGNIATLAVHDHPEFNRLAVDGEGLLRGIGWAGRSETVEHVAFTGVALYEPRFLRFLPEGPSSVVEGWLNAVAAGEGVGTWSAAGCSWSDIGTVSAYASAVFRTLRAEGETVYVHPSVEGCGTVELGGCVVVEEGGGLGGGARLRNCIILPGGRAEPGLEYENCILGPGFRVDLNGSETSGLTDEARLIGTGGSDRRYYRVKRDGGSAVLMQSSDDDPDFERQIEYTRFFLRHSVPVPELIAVEADRKRALFEDLGDLTLYSWLKCPREHARIEEIYGEVIEIMVAIHTEATEHVSECPLLQSRIFDYDHLRWETRYFIERFVEGVRGVKVENPLALEREFHRLASKVDSFPKTVIHRDFHSQNIMITGGGVPRPVDYQGARIGPPGYDLVSLLWDPYHRLDDGVRRRLLDRYVERMREAAGAWFSEEGFRETLLPCRLQRHMQALGAYGYLARVKGKGHFLKYVPEGLRLLKEDLSISIGEYPELYGLVMGLRVS